MHPSDAAGWCIPRMHLITLIILNNYVWKTTHSAPVPLLAFTTRVWPFSTACFTVWTLSLPMPYACFHARWQTLTLAPLICERGKEEALVACVCLLQSKVGLGCTSFGPSRTLVR